MTFLIVLQVQGCKCVFLCVRACVRVVPVWALFSNGFRYRMTQLHTCLAAQC